MSARPERSRLYPWYDSVWLESHTRARQIIQKVRPAALAEFEQAMQVFRTPLDFKVKAFDRVVDDDTLAEIRRVVRGLKPTEFELHETRMFKRFVVHDHPYFTQLQQGLTDLVSEHAGETVEPNYNFLSLYTAMGVCPVHMDAPQAKWTLDLCLDQSESWPIHFSQVQPWPEVDPALECDLWKGENWQQDIVNSPAQKFESYAMEPGQAILFSGSSQWHYRNAMPAGGRRSHCDLLFFHFIPKGTIDLVRPGEWARIFGIPELEDC